jgi:cystathionine gamma-synthase
MYGRTSNPNRAALESCLAALEGGAACAAFASGMAATSALFQSLSPGDHVIAPANSYYGTGVVLRRIFMRWGLDVSFVDLCDPAAVERELRARTKLIWVETPSNPMLSIADIGALAALAHAAGALCACDNTFATPALQRPFEHGADIIMHSTTKYLSGHSDLIGGALIAREDGEVFAAIREVQTQMGAVPSPFDCWLALRGIKTLPYRMRGHCESAARVAAWLAAQPRVERVLYPGLPGHPGHALAAAQMSMFGGMISFNIHGGAHEALAVAARARLFTRATSLGGVHSLIEHRASVEAPGTGTPANLLRLSIGLEHPDDLIEDLAWAMEEEGGDRR